ANAFDTVGLFSGSHAWFMESPYWRSCAIPGGFYESRGCARTVEIGNECWKAGTVNYGTYGIMMRSCADGTSRPSSDFANQLENIWAIATTPSNMLATTVMRPFVAPLSSEALHARLLRPVVSTLVTAYKAYDRDDPSPCVRWALATYDRGPSGVASG